MILNAKLAEYYSECTTGSIFFWMLNWNSMILNTNWYSMILNAMLVQYDSECKTGRKWFWMQNWYNMILNAKLVQYDSECKTCTIWIWLSAKMVQCDSECKTGTICKINRNVSEHKVKVRQWHKWHVTVILLFLRCPTCTNRMHKLYQKAFELDVWYLFYLFGLWSRSSHYFLKTKKNQINFIRVMALLKFGIL